MADEVEYSWTIPDLSKLPQEVDFAVASPEFIQASLKLQIVWRILLYPFGKREDNTRDVSFALELVRCNHEYVKTTLELELIVEENTINERTRKMSFGKAVCSYREREFRWSTGAFGLAPDDAVVNAVRTGKRATAYVKVYNTTIYGPFIPFCQNSPNNLMDIYWPMYKEQTLTDVKLIVGNKEFKLHKLMLAARSRIFKAMFQHEVEEVAQNQVVITDFEPEVVEDFIRFIYCNKCDSNNATELLKLADKYFVDDLKFECEKTLIHKFKPENAVAMLLLADTYRATHLRLAASEFIENHALDVMQTEHWGELSKEMLNEIIKKLSLKLAQRNQ